MSATGFAGVKDPLASLGGCTALDSSSTPSQLACIQAARAART
jgi:hypothetical protein